MFIQMINPSPFAISSINVHQNNLNEFSLKTNVLHPAFLYPASNLKHGLLVFAVFHLCCGEVEDASLHGVLVAVVDEVVGPANNHKMLPP